MLKINQKSIISWSRSHVGTLKIGMSGSNKIMQVYKI